MFEGLESAARCAVHADRIASGACKLCGAQTCGDCNVAGFQRGIVCKVCARTTQPSRFYVVPGWRFMLFGVLTAGLYILYWFWKNWKRIKETDGSDIWPIPRTLFSGITSFMLITEINTQLALRDKGDRLSAGLGILYLLSNGLSRMPHPYWMLAPLISGLILLPLVNAIGTVASEAALAESKRWRTRHTVLTLISTPLFLVILFFGEE
jgi:hypothetical protein